MKTKYLEYISESRYKTHGLMSVKRTIPKYLDSVGVKYDVEYNYETDDFSIYFNNQYHIKTLSTLISRCEILGYFPSVFEIDNIIIKYGETIEDFVCFVKNYKLPVIFNEIYIQFESWLDEEIITPRFLYHVFEAEVEMKIKRYGLSPKSKHKISYHPDRIYLSLNLKDANNFIKQLKDNNPNKIYKIVEIDTQLIDNKYNLLIRKDPNYNVGVYTTQNIHPSWFLKII